MFSRRNEDAVDHKVAVITVGKKGSKYILFGGLIISSFCCCWFWLYFTQCYLIASELSLFSSLPFKIHQEQGRVLRNRCRCS